jgi:hypothetical protein
MVPPLVRTASELKEEEPMRQWQWWTLAGALTVLVPAVRAGEDAPQTCPAAHCGGWILSPCFLGDGTPLSAPIASFEVHDTPLRQVLNLLVQKSEVPLIVDVEAIQARGIDLDQPVTITVQNVPLNMLLAQLLVPCGLSWEFKDDAVHVVPQSEEANGPAPAPRIGRKTIKPSTEALLSAGRLLEQVAQETKQDKDRERLRKQARKCYERALQQDPNCQEAFEGLLRFLPSPSTSEEGCGARTKGSAPRVSDRCRTFGTFTFGTDSEDSAPPACQAKQEPACYPDVAKRSEDSVPEECACEGIICAGGSLVKMPSPLEQCCSSCCSGCVGCCIGSMLGCVVDHPLLGAWLGRCVSALTPRMFPASSDYGPPPMPAPPAQPCPMCPSPIGYAPPPMPPPMLPPPCMAAIPAPPACAPPMPPMDADPAWTLSKGPHGLCFSGPGVEGRCDTVSFGPDGCILLQGHVHLKCHKDGHHAEVTADRAWVRLADMSVQIMPQGALPMPPYPAPCYWPGTGAY